VLIAVGPNDLLQADQWRRCGLEEAWNPARIGFRPFIARRTVNNFRSLISKIAHCARRLGAGHFDDEVLFDFLPLVKP
jgi:hypothetical protein